MKYRIGRETDKAAILEYAKLKGIDPPNFAICFMAESDEGKVVGYVNAGLVNLLDSFACDSPVASLYLIAMVEGAIAIQGLPTTFAGTISDKAGDILLRLGYVEIKNTRFFIKKG